MTPAIELAQWLADQLGLVFGSDAEWSFHASGEPEQPDNVVTLYDTAGASPLAIDGADMARPGLQVRVRSTDYLGGVARHKEIRELLVQPGRGLTTETIERTIGEGRYVSIFPVGDMLSLGRDSNRRHVLVANFQLIRQQLEQAS
jgi:hypothetical protein